MAVSGVTRLFNRKEWQHDEFTGDRIHERYLNLALGDTRAIALKWKRWASFNDKQIVAFGGSDLNRRAKIREVYSLNSKLQDNVNA